MTTPSSSEHRTPRIRRSGMAEASVDVQWYGVAGAAAYDVELLDGGRRIATTSVPATVRQQHFSIDPYEPRAYEIRVRARAGDGASPWSARPLVPRSEALAESRTSALDPLLQTLLNALNAAAQTPPNTVPVDATMVGTAGAGIITALQGALGTASVTFAAGVTISSDETANTVTVDGNVTDNVLQIDGPHANAVFRVADGELVIVLTIETPEEWTFSTTVPALAGTITDTLTWENDVDSWPQFVVSNTPGSNDPAGLHFQAHLQLQGFSATLLQLIPGATNPLPVAGTVALTAPQLADIVLRASVAAVSLPLPGLQTLTFGGASFVIRTTSDGVSGYLTEQQGVEADVTLGGLTVPLAIVLPTGSSGWSVGLIPGRAVPIPALVQFLGFVTGTSLGGTMPDGLKAVEHFQISTFRINLTGDRASFRDLFLVVENDGTAGATWTLFDGLTLNALSLEFRLNNLPSGLTVAAVVSGTFTAGSSLQLRATLALPPGAGAWVLSASTRTEIPNFDAFSGYLGGQSLAPLLPAGLGGLPQFDLDLFELVFDPVQLAITSISLQVTTSAPWVIIANAPHVEIRSVGFAIRVDSPASSPQLTGSVGGALVVGTTTVGAVVSKSDPASDWLLHVDVDELPLPSLNDLAGIVGTDLTPLLPVGFATNTFTLSNLALQVNISQQKALSLTFAVTSSDTWVFIEKLLAVSEAGLLFGADWSAPAARYTGAIWGTVMFAGQPISLSATKETDGWVFAGALVGDGLNVMTTADYLIPGASATLQSLGVPTVTLVTASLTYATKDSSYAFAAQVSLTGPGNQPWGIAVGRTGISVTALGIKVQKSGTAPMKVLLSGSLAIGTTTTFSVAYEIGGDLVLQGQLVSGQDHVSIYDMLTALADPSAQGVTWTNNFTPLQQITFSNVALTVKLGATKSLQIGGTMTVGSVANINAFFLLQKTASAQWQFALAIEITTDFTMAGLTDAFAAFVFGKSTWALAASSFTDASFTFPPPVSLPAVRSIDRGLNFYAIIDITHTLDTINNVIALLPAGTIPSTTLIVHGVLVQPIANAYLEVVLSASDAGLPLLGWEDVRLAKFALQLWGTPAFAIEGQFILRFVTNSDGSYFRLGLRVLITTTYAAVVVLRQGTAIFTWVHPLGIPSLVLELTDLDLKLYYAGTIAGTIGGGVTFQVAQGVNTILSGTRPDPVVVLHILRKMAARDYAGALAEAVTTGELVAASELSREIDPDDISIHMLVSLMVVPESPEPVIPTRIAGHFVNFTLPYILRKFTGIAIPEILFPVLFNDVQFDVSFNPLEPSKVLNFAFDGKLTIFGLHGNIAASFKETEGVFFHAEMDPIDFRVGGVPIVQIRRSSSEPALGPYVTVDSKAVAPKAVIDAAIDCNFFDVIHFTGRALVKRAEPVSDSFFVFDMAGTIGALGAVTLHAEYQKMNYLNVTGGFFFGLSTAGIPGFTVQKDGVTYRAADTIDLSKAAAAVVLTAHLTLILDARNPASPSFTMNVGGSFLVKAGPCQWTCQLGLDVQVTRDTWQQLPGEITTALMTNSQQIFGLLVSSANCFYELLKIGLFILEEAVNVARMLANFFETGVDLGAGFLSDLGHAVEDVAGWLWDVFGSHDTSRNTRALKETGNYTDSEVSRAIKDIADRGGQPYTEEQMVRDQMAAGYDVVAMARALFGNYSDLQNNSGRMAQLLKGAPFAIGRVAAGLHATYTLSAEQMSTTLLGQFADASAQELADSLAPFYPVAETARAVWTHFSSSVPRAADMAAILISAYTRASKQLHAADMAGALAPFYPAPATSTVLKTNYAGDIANATAMATLLQTAYTAAGTALTPQVMATALTGAPYSVAETAVAMRAAFPAQTDTASKMAGYLYNASVPPPGFAAMAAALAGVPYPADQVAAAIYQYYQQDVGTALKMAQLLAPSYPADQIAAPLHATYPAETATPDALYAILVTAYQPATIAAPVMAGAFARAPYSAVAAAPALRTNYPAVTQTATDMATLLVAAYVTPAIDARTIARALAASPYDIAGTTAALLAKFAADMQTAASAAQILAQASYPASAVGPQLRTSYETATRQASAMTSILAQAPYAAVEVAPVLRTLYPEDTATPAKMYALLAASYTLTAPLMAHALAVSPYPAPQVAPVLRTNYAADTATPGAMQQLLAAAYAPQQLDAQTMADALARSPYTVLLVVPVLRASYAADTNTAQKLGTILHTAYSGILLTDLLSALAAAPYNALDNTPVLVSLYTPLSTDLATALVAAYPGSAALSSLQLGVALGAGAYDSAKIAAGIHQGIPSTSAGVMAVALLLAQSSTVASAISAAQGFRTAGDTARAAAPKIVQALPAITAYELAAALTSVFTPPNLTSTELANLLAATWTTPLPGDVASAVLANFPTLQPSPFLSLLQSAWTTAGKVLDQNGAAAALAQGYRYIGGSVTMTQVAQLLITSYPTSATVDSIARSLASGYGLAANTRDATQLLTALREGFAGTAIRIDATIATSAATAALALTPGQAAVIAPAASQAFSLTRSPNDVGGLAVALRVAAFQQAGTLEAFASIFNPWNATAQQIATTAFTSAAWQQAYTLKAGGQTVQAAAPAIHTQHPATGEVDMVRMLAATWYYLTTATAVRPIAEAMKAANYTLSQCAYGMNQQYSPDWTPADYQVVAEVYKGGNDVTSPVTDRRIGNITLTIASVVEDAGNLNDAAYGCRIAGFDPILCAPQLKQTYPSSSANEMAIALARGWAGIINTPTMTSALTAAPYPAVDVQAAVAAIVHLNLVDNSLYPDPQVSTMQRALALTQGDLTKLTAGELVDFLVVSCLPGDYSPSQGSLVGALAAIGVSVQQLSASKAADYRSNYHCWISQPVPGQNFTQLLVFESTGQDAVQNIPGILLGVQAFMPTPHAGSNYPYANVATSMVSTGSGGAQPNAVLTALFNSAKGVMKSAYDLGAFRIDIYAAAQVPPLQTLFDQLKAQ